MNPIAGSYTPQRFLSVSYGIFAHHMSRPWAKRRQGLMSSIEPSLPYWIVTVYARDLGGKMNDDPSVIVLLGEPRDPCLGRHGNVFTAVRQRHVRVLGTRLLMPEDGCWHLQQTNCHGPLCAQEIPAGSLRLGFCICNALPLMARANFAERCKTPKIVAALEKSLLG